MDGELIVVLGLIAAAVVAGLLGLVSWRRRHRHHHRDSEDIYSHVAAGTDPHSGLDQPPPPT